MAIGHHVDVLKCKILFAEVSAGPRYTSVPNSVKIGSLLLRYCNFSIFSVRCNIYISCLCYDVSVRLSVTEVHWRIIANLGFEFRSKFTAHCGRT